MTPKVKVVRMGEDIGTLCSEDNDRIFVTYQWHASKVSYVARLIDFRAPCWQITTAKYIGPNPMFFIQKQPYGIWKVPYEEFFDYMKQNYKQDLQWLLFHPEIYEENYYDEI